MIYEKRAGGWSPLEDAKSVAGPSGPPTRQEELATQRQMDEVDGALRDLPLPFAAWEAVTVTFTGAGADVDVPHSLAPSIPDEVRWFVASVNADIRVYRDSAATKPWQPTHVWLRASGAGVARLILFLEA